MSRRPKFEARNCGCCLCAVTAGLWFVVVCGLRKLSRGGIDSTREVKIKSRGVALGGELLLVFSTGREIVGRSFDGRRAQLYSISTRPTERDRKWVSVVGGYDGGGCE